MKETGEEGDIGKAEDKKKWIAAGVVVALIAAGIGAFVHFSGTEEENPDIWAVDIQLDTIDTDDAWIVKIVAVDPTYNDPEYYAYQMNESWIEYTLRYNRSDVSPYAFQSSESFSVTDIKDAQSPMGVRWFNLNDTDTAEIGDYLLINKSGGTGGRVSANDFFEVDCIVAGGGDDVYLPPAEFLDMDVAKTFTGWNMTVTWVNETVPLNFLEGWRIGFRIMNETGAYGTFFGNGTGKIGWSVPLDMVDSTFNAEPGTYDAHNMTYYHIDWFDKDVDKRLSVNDTIVIDKFSELENTLKFSFTSGQYGYNHVVSEVTLP